MSGDTETDRARRAGERLHPDGAGLPRIHIAELCEHPGSRPLPEQVCGVDTRERLRLTLLKRGAVLEDDRDAADEVVDPCTIFAGDARLSLCRDGVVSCERALVRALRKNVDGMVARHLNRPMSGWLTSRVMRTRLRPNHVTLFTMLLGVASGPAVVLGHHLGHGYWGGVVGALLLQTQSVLDGVDGELSRLKFLGSKLGEWLDTIADDLSNLSFVAGATAISSVAWVRVTGLAGMVAFLVCQSILYVLLARVYRSGNLQVFQWDTGRDDGLLSRIEWMFKRDFFCLLFLALAVAGVLDAPVVIFSVGTTISLVALLRQLARGNL